MKKWAQLAVAVAVVCASPTAASIHNFAWDVDSTFAFPGIDPAKERITNIFSGLAGTIHWEDDIEGGGHPELAPWAVTDELIAHLTFDAGSSSMDGGLFYVDASAAWNIGGQPGTYVHYTEDLSFMNYDLNCCDVATWAYTPSNITSHVEFFRTRNEAFGVFSAPHLTQWLEVQTQPVPEPATWLMGMVGMGAVGAALRSRRRGRIEPGDKVTEAHSTG